jgi:hypothetical protein
MKILRFLIVVSLIVLSTGCNKDKMYKAFYRGITFDPIMEGNRSFDRPMTYEEYERERKKLLEKTK